MAITMTMRRISVLLVGVVVAVMMSMGTALAHSGKHTICDVRNGKDVTLYNLSHKKAQKRVNNTNDYWGKCEKGGGGFKSSDIGKVAAGR